MGRPAETSTQGETVPITFRSIRLKNTPRSVAAYTAPSARSAAIPCAGASESAPVMSSHVWPPFTVRNRCAPRPDAATSAIRGASESTAKCSTAPEACTVDSVQCARASAEVQILPSAAPAYQKSPDPATAVNSTPNLADTAVRMRISRESGATATHPERPLKAALPRPSTSMPFFGSNERTGRFGKLSFNPFQESPPSCEAHTPSSFATAINRGSAGDAARSCCPSPMTELPFNAVRFSQLRPPSSVE